MGPGESGGTVESHPSYKRLDETRPRAIKSIHRQLERALKGSMGEAEFVRNMEINLRTFGWWDVTNVGSHQGLKTIFRTNIKTAFAHWTYRRQMDGVNNRPYLLYNAIMDGHVRESHAAMHGKVFRYDDPIWHSHYPPNGWNCRCQVDALIEAEMQAEGLTLSSSDGHLSEVDLEAGTDKRTGEVVTVRGTSYSFTGKDGKAHVMTTGAGWNYKTDHSGSAFDLLTTLERTLQMLEMRESAPPCL